MEIMPNDPVAAGRSCVWGPWQLVSAGCSVAALEAFDATGGVQDAGLAGVEGVAGGGDLDVDDGIGVAVLPHDGGGAGAG
jgi:hypothetical protein